MTFAFGTTATFTPQTAAKFGERTSGTPIAIPACAFWETPGSQTVGGQDTIVYDAVLLAPHDTIVHTTDRVAVHGVTYEVVAQPIAWRSNLTNWKPCVEVHLRRVDG